MKLNKLLCGLALVAALGGSTSCAMEETLYGTYTEKAGQYDYTTAVLVTVKGDKIVEVAFAENSNHHTDPSYWTDATKWTSVEAEILASFEGKSVSEIKASETNNVYDNVAGATLTSVRVYKAVQAALNTK